MTSHNANINEPLTDEQIVEFLEKERPRIAYNGNKVVVSVSTNNAVFTVQSETLRGAVNAVQSMLNC